MTPPQPNYIQIVNAIYAAFDRGDVNAVLARCALNTDWMGYGPQDLATTGEFHGRDGVKRYFDAVDNTFNYTAFSPGRPLVSGTTVFVTGEDSGTMKVSGNPMSDRWVHVWQFEGTLVARFSEYLCNTQTPKR